MSELGAGLLLLVVVNVVLRPRDPGFLDVQGGAGADTLEGMDVADVLRGGVGNDLILGGSDGVVVIPAAVAEQLKRFRERLSTDAARLPAPDS